MKSFPDPGLVTPFTLTHAPRPPSHDTRALTHDPTPPDPRLPKNVARNSPTTISTFEFTSLKFRGFQRTPKLTILELRATF